MKTTLKDLAELLRGSFEGDPALELTGVAPIEHAAAGAVTFLANKKYQRHLTETAASAVILDASMPCPRPDVGVIRVQDPYLSFARALRFFHPAPARTETVVDPSSSVHATAVLGRGVTVGPLAVLEEGVTVGDGSTVMAGAVLTAGCAIGRDCLVYPNVSILAKARVGDRVIIHAGATIGSDGFGFAPVERTWEKIPQVGSVRIGDDVEIGANCAIDRGALEDTVIGRGSKLDNLIQIAHNVRIGEDTVIAAQAGISGSTIVGTHVIIAGQVGLVGHIEIADDVTVGAQSGVSKSILETGKVFRGSPAHEIHDELRAEAAIRQLPDLLRTVRALEAQLLLLREELDAGKALAEHS
ncbi:MAG: UDP-3-O-(3-hydroxymyristoyl)glucosamine N-acyltransferase [Ignavibacteria bacterium]|nr:UDP-3-O-(3-hydroxymyristoyl)glucosamine N-acyltransferase [Ignavibacteria bacterium]